MGLLKEFRDFALKGNVVDLAVGVIIGAAFGTVVNSVVQDILMPPLGALIAGVDFSLLSLKINTGLKDAKDALLPPVEIRYGNFINALIKFVIQAFAIFLVIKAINAARNRFEKKTDAPPAAPPEDVVLLRDIRDLLKKQA